MAREFVMPKLGLTMEAGTIVEWLVADGDEITSGTPVLVIETDKTETEVEATSDGRLHQVGAIGDTYDCGAVIGWTLADGESPPVGGTITAPTSAVAAAPDASAAAGSAPSSNAPIAPAGGRLFASPNARRIATERGIDLRTVRGTGPNGRIVSEDLDGVSDSTAAVAATSTARRLAQRLGVDLADVTADEADGRITRAAVEAHVRTALARGASEPERQPTSYPLLQTPSEIVPLTGVRGTIARRMVESQTEMAQLTLHMDADVDAIVADRDRRRGAGDVVPSYTDYVIAAAARALLEHPTVNAQVIDAGIALLPEVHVGMAVAIDGGLVVPVVTDTPALDLSALTGETSRLADAARRGTLQFADLEGGTFSVTTLGMYGVDGFSPIINPPNVAILGVGRVRDELHLGDDDRVSVVKRITLSLTWDHRVIDGAPAAEFCRSIVDRLQRPDELDQPAT